MREVISLHIGQCGVQQGASLWELLCAEHGLDFTGNLGAPELLEGFSPFFQETQKGKYVPRAVMMDTDPTCLDEVRVGRSRRLYHQANLISGKEDAANNFARGLHNVGLDVLELVEQPLRRVIEACDSLQGFFVFHSASGGTGSGMGCRLLKALNDRFPKNTAITYTTFPSPKLSTSVVEPYNAVFTVDFLTFYADLACYLDNEAIYNCLITEKSVSKPTYTDINRIICQVVSSMTSSLRFEGALNVDLPEFQTNLVPFPRMHYMNLAYAPIQNNLSNNSTVTNAGELTLACYSSTNYFMSMDPSQGLYMATCLMYRGDVVPQEMHAAVLSLRNREITKFVDWMPTGFKCGINAMPAVYLDELGEPQQLERTCTAISNNTATRFVMADMLSKFDLMYSNRAFVHWYISEGMEEGQFTESGETIRLLYRDYEVLETGSEPTPEMISI